MQRDEAIKEIKAALQRRSGKTWSVTGGKGTAYGWLHIDAPPKRRTWRYIQTKSPEPPSPGALYRGANCITPYTYIQDGSVTNLDTDPWAREALAAGREVVFDWEVEDPTYEWGHTSPADRKELAQLLGKEYVHFQGESVAASTAYRKEYVDRANGREPTVYGEQYWD